MLDSYSLQPLNTSDPPAPRTVGGCRKRKRLMAPPACELGRPAGARGPLPRFALRKCDRGLFDPKDTIAFIPQASRVSTSMFGAGHGHELLVTVRQGTGRHAGPGGVGTYFAAGQRQFPRCKALRLQQITGHRKSPRVTNSRPRRCCSSTNLPSRAHNSRASKKKRGVWRTTRAFPIHLCAEARVFSRGFMFYRGTAQRPRPLTSDPSPMRGAVGERHTQTAAQEAVPPSHANCGR